MPNYHRKPLLRQVADKTKTNFEKLKLHVRYFGVRARGDSLADTDHSEDAVIGSVHGGFCSSQWSRRLGGALLRGVEFNNIAGHLSQAVPPGSQDARARVETGYPAIRDSGHSPEVASNQHQFQVSASERPGGWVRRNAVSGPSPRHEMNQILT